MCGKMQSFDYNVSGVILHFLFTCLDLTGMGKGELLGFSMQM